MTWKLKRTTQCATVVKPFHPIVCRHYRVTWGRNVFRPTEWCVMEEIGVNIISSGPYRWPWQAWGTAAWKRFKMRIKYARQALAYAKVMRDESTDERN